MSHAATIACIAERLQELKDKIHPSKWSETPLPVIAAPQAWIDEVRAEFGAGQPDDVTVDEIHGCKIVAKDDLTRPWLIDHDGKVYAIVPGLAKNPIAAAAEGAGNVH